jgi:hypothetical protein
MSASAISFPPRLVLALWVAVCLGGSCEAGAAGAAAAAAAVCVAETSAYRAERCLFPGVVVAGVVVGGGGGIFVVDKGLTPRSHIRMTRGLIAAINVVASVVVSD